MRIRTGASFSRSRAVRCLAVAAVGVTALAGACSRATTQSVTVTPAALVAESAHTTLDQKTADLTLSGTISVAGQHLPLTGTGAADFVSQAMSLNLSTKVSGQSINIKELLASGQLYMGGNFGSSSFADLTGKDWVSLPVPSSGQDIFGSDPFAQLKVLEQQGASVTPLGQKTIDGNSTTGFSIVPTKASMLKAATTELSQMGFDSSQASQIQSAIQQMQPPTITIWLDSSHLVRQMSVNLDMGAVSSGSSVVMNLNVDHYGVPVNISAPPSSDVVSFKQFLQDVQQAGSSSS
ncbi:MAG TPA: hypothetical protein VNF71_03355 [Acidimicrobiales bacterium]|nr:hypothetical protein [Acidimicrobiales bacterium]